MKKILTIFSATALLLCVFACHRNAQWQIKGEIEGADGETVVLESLFNGSWFALDSVKVKSNGKFSFKEPAIPYPAIYRLSFNGKKAYFPVDSAETITFNGHADTFDRNYLLKGSPNAERITKANRIIASAGAKAKSDLDLKRSLGEIILEDPAGISAYYIINSSTSAGQPIFDRNDNFDLRIIGAVANAYSEQRPDDPRTTLLKNIFLQNKKVTSSNVNVNDTLVAAEMAFPEILLLDERGTARSLIEVAENHPVLLNFTVYGAEYSPALNMELGQIYDDYSGAGLEIYQIAYDPDEFQWRQSARNLPWITVYNPPKEGVNYLVQYNVGQLPATFIINRNGELVERVTDHSRLRESLKKHL